MIIMKIWAMMNMNIEDVDFSSSKFTPVVENVVISEEQETRMLDIFDYAYDVHDKILGEKSKIEKKVAKMFYTETHLVSMVPFIQKAISREIDADAFSDWVLKFFTEEGGQLREYNDAVKIGSSKNANIIIRNNIISHDFEEYFS